jgi:hypothetical protein
MVHCNAAFLKVIPIMRRGDARELKGITGTGSVHPRAQRLGAAAAQCRDFQIGVE